MADDSRSKLKLPGPPVVRAEAAMANDKTWMDLSRHAATNSLSVFRHHYLIDHPMDGVMSSHSVDVAHVASTPFKTGLSKPDSGSVELSKHNIATRQPEVAPKSHPDLLKASGPSAEITARNAMRVLKGTHNYKPLIGKERAHVESSIELAAEIGVSEVSRGGGAALLDGQMSLYRMKHKALSADNFSDYKHGFRGAGQGGAARLRELGNNANEIFEGRGEEMRALWASHARKKGKWKDKTYEEWRAHKIAKWTQKLGE